ncbi:MAG: pseudouridine synthase [Candidatus Margulisbacteria bacterium]|nr:pseudouridine synthase [Candidatus Margulisiibacteriota bacterium]
MENELVRIQKYFSNQKILSRRKTEEYIQKGWILLNGKTVTDLGTKINPLLDKVEISPLADKVEYTYLLFNKPWGVFTNCPEDGCEQITDLLPKKYSHLSSVGRLDKDSEGLILMTDDGTVANHFLNSGIEHEREYEVTIDTILTQGMIDKLESGIRMMDIVTKPAKVNVYSKQRFTITLSEGKNRQIRRMLRKVGANVIKLTRISFAGLKLGDLRSGDYRLLNKSDLM